MIVNALIGILIAFLNGINSLLSQQADVPEFTGLSTAVATASGYYSAMDAFFPFSTLFAIIGLYLIFEGILWGYKGIKWIYQKIPGVN